MHPPPPISHFDRLIEDLTDAAHSSEDAPRPAHPFSIDSLEAAWDAAASARALPAAAADFASRGHFYSFEGEAAPEISLDPKCILNDLGLTEGVTSEAEVTLVRREFALRNHPDRVPPELQKAATERMMIANALIDQHIARLRNTTR